jgi:hypothetical protein
MCFRRETVKMMIMVTEIYASFRTLPLLLCRTCWWVRLLAWLVKLREKGDLIQ